MRSVYALAAAAAADAVRSRVIWVVVLFAAVLAVGIPSLPSYGTGVDVGVFREVAIALTWFAAMIVAIGLSSTRIPREIERRTVYVVLGRDVRRWQYLLGTWLGIIAVMAAVVLAFVIVTMGVGALRYEEVPWRLLESGLAVWLEAAVVAAFAVLFSTFGHPVTTVVASIAFLFIGHSVRTLMPESIATVVPTLAAFNVINPVAHGDGISVVYGLVMVGAALAWSGLWLSVGALVFARRDL